MASSGVIRCQAASCCNRNGTPADNEVPALNLIQRLTSSSRPRQDAARSSMRASWASSRMTSGCAFSRSSTSSSTATHFFHRCTGMCVLIDGLMSNSAETTWIRTYDADSASHSGPYVMAHGRRC